MVLSPDSILLVFPHGLGDFIMATPTFRRLREKYPGSRLDLAVNFVAVTQGLAQTYPYFDNVYAVHSPWFSSNYEIGLKQLERQVEELVTAENYEHVFWIRHDRRKQPGLHCVHVTAHEVGIDLGDDTEYEIHIDDELERHALNWLKRKGFELGKYAFIQNKSSDIKKNISIKELRCIIPDSFSRNLVVVGESFDITNYPIGFSFSLLKHSGYLALVDSVFVHAADALNKTIDIHVTNDLIRSWKNPIHVEINNQIIRKTGGIKPRLLHNINRVSHIGFRLKTAWGESKAKHALDERLSSIINEVSGSGEFESIGGLFLVGFFIIKREHQFVVRKPYVALMKKVEGFVHVVAVDELGPRLSKLEEAFHMLPECLYEAPYINEVLDMANYKTNQMLANFYSEEKYWIGYLE